MSDLVNKPDEKTGTKLDRNIAKGIKKFTEEISYKNRNHAIIVGDSKCRELQKQRDHNSHVNIFYQPGAKLNNGHIDSYIRRHLTNVFNKPPIVLIWLGTCELTVKTRRGFDLVPNISDHVDTIIENYKLYKQQLEALKPSVRIIFLPCPYFNLDTFNVSRKYKTINITREQQLALEHSIKKYNRELITLNNINTPVICEDLIRRGKGKTHKSQQKTIDYRHLIDGCHPSVEITKLWLLKFVKLIDRI